MVDALRRVREWLSPSGVVVDLHPTADVATILVGDTPAGPIDPGGAVERHQAAGDALLAVVRDGLYAIEDELEFDFSTVADSLEELHEHILEDWREARIGARTYARAAALLMPTAAARVRVLERVAAARLRPLAR